MRHRSRHVQQTLADHLRAGLTGMGWMSEEGPRPFGIARPVRFVDVDIDDLLDASPDERVEFRKRIEGYVLTLTIENEAEDLLQELGGPLYQVPITVSIDVWGELTSVTMALSSDVKDLLRDAFIPVKNYATGEVTEDYIEPDVVRIEKPGGHVIGIDFKKRWRIVSLDAEVTFTDAPMPVPVDAP
jgi:hypothetical protein